MYFAAGPGLPTGVSVENGAECYTSMASWVAPQDRCGVVAGNYSVRYQQRNCGGDYTTVNTSSTSVTLQGLTPNAEYTVSVAAINSAGEMSSFTEATQFQLQGDLCMCSTVVLMQSCTPHSDQMYFFLSYRMLHMFIVFRANTSNRCDL